MFVPLFVHNMCYQVWQLTKSIEMLTISSFHIAAGENLGINSTVAPM